VLFQSWERTDGWSDVFVVALVPAGNTASPALQRRDLIQIQGQIKAGRDGTAVKSKKQKVKNNKKVKSNISLNVNLLTNIGLIISFIQCF